jgi:hypothetical protein
MYFPLPTGLCHCQVNHLSRGVMKYLIILPLLLSGCVRDNKPVDVIPQEMGVITCLPIPDSHTVPSNWQELCHVCSYTSNHTWCEYWVHSKVR